jgi:hypothetical protein
MGFMQCRSGVLNQFLELYQVKSNMNLRDKTKMRSLAQNFDDDWVLPSILSSGSRILSTALLSRYFRASIIFIAFCQILIAFVNANASLNFFVVRGRYFRFVPNESIPPDCSIDIGSIVFRYEARTCEWPHKFYNVSAQGGALVFSFKETVGITGWSMKRSFCLAPSDHTGYRFDLTEALMTKENQMILQRSYDGMRFQDLNPSWLERVPLHQAVNFRPSFLWIARHIVVPVLLSVFVIAGCFKGACGEGNAGAKLIALGYFTSFWLTFTVAWSDGSEGVLHTYAIYAMYSVLSFIEYKILEVCVLSWVIQLTTVPIDLHRKDPTALHPTGLFHLEALIKTCLTLAAVTLIIRRYLYREHLRHMVDKDREQIASIFQGIRHDASLSRLADTCDEIARGLNADSTALKQPTRNLTQLRAQAAALKILMDSKISAWSSCFFSSLGEPECTEKDAEINTVKLFACLDGDTAKLFDYCAGNIVFDDIGRLLLCLKFIKGDESVRIVRLENSFGLWNQKSDTLGYRYVSTLAAKPSISVF